MQDKHALDRTEWFVIGLLAIFLVAFPLAFWNGVIGTDEAWLGQQVWAYATTGQVVSDLFRDVPPLDGRIVVYHKFLIWAGVAVTKLIGWSILPLRSLSALAGLAIVLLLLFQRPFGEDRRTRMLAAAILLFTPLFWSYLRMFRPEMMLLAFGWGSFLALRGAEGSHRPGLLLLSAGALAGLAGLTHAVGLAFAVAGSTALLMERRWRHVVLFGFAAVLVFSPYISGHVTDPELFHRQLFANAFTDARLSLGWWQPITNLVHEHTRLFRKPEVIGLSAAFALALLLFTREQWRKDRFLFVYLATLLVIDGMAPLPKITRYMLPLTPFFAITVARGWWESCAAEGYRRAVRKVLGCWLILFFLYGLYALGSAALGKPSHQLETNRLLSEQIQPGSVVMAPFDFVYDGSTQFVVQSWWGCERAAHELPTPESVESYAIRTNVQYIILDSLRMEKLHLVPRQIPNAFHRYSPLLELPEHQRYLLMRKEQPKPLTHAGRRLLLTSTMSI